jgi:hypothetical protein
MRSEIRVVAQSAATVSPAPLGFVPLDPLPSFHLPPVEEDLDLFVPRELLQ